MGSPQSRQWSLTIIFRPNPRYHFAEFYPEEHMCPNTYFFLIPTLVSNISSVLTSEYRFSEVNINYFKGNMMGTIFTVPPFPADVIMYQTVNKTKWCVAPSSCGLFLRQCITGFIIMSGGNWFSWRCHINLKPYYDISHQWLHFLLIVPVKDNCPY